MTAAATKYFEHEANNVVLRGTVKVFPNSDRRVEVTLLRRHDDDRLYRSMRLDAYQYTRELHTGAISSSTIVWLMGSVSSDLLEFESAERFSGCDLLNLAVAAAEASIFQPYIAEMASAF